jgi:Na+-transporting NADH:ubiquinone oxidoreductase subunit NqrB
MASSIRYQAQLIYYRYEINTGLYVMSPGEKLAFNLVNLTIVALLLSVVYYFLPLSLVGYVQHLVGGVWESITNAKAQEKKMQGALLQGLLPGEATASLREGGMGANASMAALPGMF